MCPDGIALKLAPNTVLIRVDFDHAITDRGSASIDDDRIAIPESRGHTARLLHTLRITVSKCAMHASEAAHKRQAELDPDYLQRLQHDIERMRSFEAVDWRSILSSCARRSSTCCCSESHGFRYGRTTARWRSPCASPSPIDMASSPFHADSP